MGCFPVDFQEIKRPLRTKSVKRPIKVGKWPINEGKRPIKAKVLVGVSVGSLMGCFRAPPPWRKTAPLRRPIKRSMRHPEIRANLRIDSRESGHLSSPLLGQASLGTFSETDIRSSMRQEVSETCRWHSYPGAQCNSAWGQDWLCPSLSPRGNAKWYKRWTENMHRVKGKTTHLCNKNMMLGVWQT